MSGISTAPPARTAPRDALSPRTRRSTPQDPVQHPGLHSGQLPRQFPGQFQGQVPGVPARRVRHEVRDGVAVFLFSAVTSCGLALVLTVLARLGN